MKKFTKILSLVLAVMMLVTLVACDKPGAAKKEETVVGKWQGELSNKAIETILGELEMDMELESKLTIYFEFGEDGKGKLSFDESSMKAFAEEVAVVTLDAMTEALGMSVDEMLEAMGMTKEEYIAEASKEMDMTEMDSAYTYTVEGDKLTLIDDANAKTIITFAFADGKLEMKDAQEEGAEELLKVMFPMTLTRVN